MPKFAIERNVPGAGALSAEQLRHIARTSNATLKEMGKPYHWVQTFVTGDKLYCVHVASDPVRPHVRMRRSFHRGHVERLHSTRPHAASMAKRARSALGLRAAEPTGQTC